MSSSSRFKHPADGGDFAPAAVPSSLLGRRVPFSNGMTLIELMIVVAIVGILAAIAYPSYRQQVMRSARTDGKVELMQAAQSLEKCFTMYGAYNNANCAVLPLLAQGIPSEGGRYLVTSLAVQPTTYRLQAAPQGAQAQDVRCANLTLDSTGLRGRSGTAPTVQECW